jgi:hypothetical protein
MIGRVYAMVVAGSTNFTASLHSEGGRVEIVGVAREMVEEERKYLRVYFLKYIIEGYNVAAGTHSCVSIRKIGDDNVKARFSLFDTATCECDVVFLGIAIYENRLYN